MLIFAQKMKSNLVKIAGYTLVGLLVFAPDKDEGIRFFPTKTPDAKSFNAPYITIKMGEKTRKFLGDTEEEATETTAKIVTHKTSENK